MGLQEGLESRREVLSSVKFIGQDHFGGVEKFLLST